MCAAAMAARQVREQRAAKEPDESWSQEQLDIFEMTRTSSSREFKVLGPHTSVDNNECCGSSAYFQSDKLSSEKSSGYTKLKVRLCSVVSLNGMVNGD